MRLHGHKFDARKFESAATDCHAALESDGDARNRRRDRALADLGNSTFSRTCAIARMLSISSGGTFVFIAMRKMQEDGCNPSSMHRAMTFSGSPDVAQIKVRFSTISSSRCNDSLRFGGGDRLAWSWLCGVTVRRAPSAIRHCDEILQPLRCSSSCKAA